MPCWQQQPAWTMTIGEHPGRETGLRASLCGVVAHDCMVFRSPAPGSCQCGLLTIGCTYPPRPALSILRYKDCEPLLLTATNGTQFKFAGVRELLKPNAIGAPASAAAAPAVPPLSAAQVCNQLRLHMRRSIAGYYEGRLRSDDDMTPCDTRNVCLAVREDTRPGTVPPDSRCTGHMRQVVSESQLYTQVGVC